METVAEISGAIEVGGIRRFSHELRLRPQQAKYGLK
jgi:hypothetical protein